MLINQGIIINQYSYRTYDDRGLINVGQNDVWYILIGKGKTIHYVKFVKMTNRIIWLKDLTSISKRAKPYLHGQIYLIEKP